MNFLNRIGQDFSKAKTRITHFLTGNKAGIEIEHIGAEIVALPGFAAFLTRAKDFGIGVAKDLVLSATQAPGSKSVNDIIGSVKDRVASEFHSDLNAVGAGWEHAAASIAFQEASTLPEVNSVLHLLAPSLAPTQTKV